MRGGEEVTLAIESLAFGGDSVARAADGRVVFVAGGAPGDQVRVRLDEVKPRFARASLLRVVEPGPDHAAVRCALVGRCGGCQWQQASLSAQRAAKQAIVERALGGVGAFRVEVGPLVAAAPDWAYRSRARMTVGEAHGRRTLGFQARRTHEVVDVETCPLLDPALDGALASARRLLAPHLPPGTSIAGLVGRGGRAQIAVRSGEGQRRLDGGAPGSPLRAAFEALLAEAGVLSILVEGAPLPPPVDARTRPEGPRGAIGVGDPGEPPFFASADGFAQASHEGNRALRTLVAVEARRLLAGLGAPRVLELFAGDGNLSRDLLPLATGGLLAVESDHAASERFAVNVPGARGMARPAAEAAAALLADGERFDLVVLDPPRSGAADVAPLLPRLAERVLYVSCDPMTLGRDARVLAGAGLGMLRATPVDLMPHTGHVEVVCSFTLGDR